MRTEQLITLLSNDNVLPGPIPQRVLLLAGAALISAGFVLLQILGIRGDLTQAVFTPVTATKWLLPLGVALPALTAALSLTRPQTLRTPVLWIALAVGAMTGLWLLSFILSTPAGQLWPTMRGSSLYICLTSVVSISLVPLGLALWILRDGASPAPMHCGACAGLAVGGLSAAIYALHCTEDAPLFFLTWYGLGILIVTGIGAIAGRHLLRW